MKNDLDLFEDREKDWLAKEIRRENLLVTDFDINDARKLKLEHYQAHHGNIKPKKSNNEALDTILLFLFIFLVMTIVFIFMTLARGYFYDFCDYCHCAYCGWFNFLYVHCTSR